MRLERLRDARRGEARRWATLPVALVTLSASACGSSPQCTCPDRAIYVKVPDDRAAAVIGVMPSGAACTGVTPSCSEHGVSSGACTLYRIAPITSGACHVDIDFAAQGPRFSTDARVVASGGCCGGLVTDPPSASEVDVPSAGDAGVVADAGGAE